MPREKTRPQAKKRREMLKFPLSRKANRSAKSAGPRLNRADRALETKFSQHPIQGSG